MAEYAGNVDALNTSLGQKYRTFLEGLSDEEFALYGTSLDGEEAETQGFALSLSFGGFTAQTSLTSVLQDVSLTRQKTAHKALGAYEGYSKF